jgi:Fe-S-cluster formation regulator IscX/YfhJ
MVQINAQFDCTQRGLINDITRLIAKDMGYIISDEVEVTHSVNPRTIQFTQIACDIFELLTGDSPSFDDDELDEESVQSVVESHYFQVIDFDAFDKEGDIQPIADRKYIEGNLEVHKDWCFSHLIGGKSKFVPCQAYAIDPANPIYIYLASVPWSGGIHGYYVTTNFDVAKHQVSLGLKSTVGSDQSKI